MGKRSNFPRHERDFYSTPKGAVVPLVPHLPKGVKYAEPCCGTLDLIHHLCEFDVCCTYCSDITRGDDGLLLGEVHVKNANLIITNPPWSRHILHPMIEHFRMLRPTWLLFDADWAFTKQSIPYMRFCSDIVPVGRVKWIPDSKHTGKDNCAWYQFQYYECATIFHGRM